MQFGTRFLESFFKLIPHWKERMSRDPGLQGPFTQVVRIFMREFGYRDECMHTFNPLIVD